jgi:hypothetical protein
VETEQNCSYPGFCGGPLPAWLISAYANRAFTHQNAHI